MNTKQRSVLVAVGSAVVGVVLVVLAARALHWLAFGDEYKKLRQVQVGMSEQQVTAILGRPDLDYAKDTAPSNYYVDGYTHPKRAISAKLLIYIENEAIAYVYVGADGRVEEIFVGGS